ncbi:MAG TPA: hypothetical protein VMZ91_01545 [Candidatus Paceibacterota bacterium]|nr:hypothetical protein [Candidatus Paceibacterota bacterium]
MIGICDICGKRTNLDYSEPDINYYSYKCGKCRGYKSDKEAIKDKEYCETELTKSQNKDKVWKGGLKK